MENEKPEVARLSAQTESFNMGVEVGRAMLRYEAAIEQRDRMIKDLEGRLNATQESLNAANTKLTALLNKETEVA